MYIEVSALRLRDNMRTYIDHMIATGDRVMITRYGRPVAALVSPADLEALEKVENNREVFLQTRHEAQLEEFRTMKAAMKGEG